MSSQSRPTGIFAADQQVLRFHADGTVLEALVRPAPGPADGAAIEGWLRANPLIAGVHRARYRLRGQALSFTCPSHFRDDERITFRGTWERGRLTLEVIGRGWTRAPVLFERIWG